MGNATSIGSIGTAKMMTFGGSNGTRGIIAGGTTGANPSNTFSRIDYYTMATGKNASGKRIIWSKERAEQTFFKNKKRKPEPPKVTRWN